MTRIVAALLASTFILTGCSSGIEGDWQSREKLANKQRNRLTFDADGVGSMKIYVRLSDDQLYKVKFDNEWEIDGNGDYDIVATCDSGCPDGVSEEFELECTLDDNDLLDCKATAPYREYGYFEFEPMLAEE